MLTLSLYTTQAPKGERQRNTLNSTLCSSRKYPYPHHRGNWKFQRGGGGGSKSQEIPERMGGKRWNFRPEGKKSIDFLRMSIGATYLLYCSLVILSGSKDSKRLTVLNCLQSRFGVLTLVSQLKHSKSFGLAKKKTRWSRRLAKFRINLPFATPYWLQPSLNFDLHWA